MAQHLQGGQGWRGDGRHVPGNQQGGANGRYGRYGQTPDQGIPQGEADSIDRGAQNEVQGLGGDPAQSNAATAAGAPDSSADYHSAVASLSRYRQPQDQQAPEQQGGGGWDEQPMGENSAQGISGDQADQGYQNLGQQQAADQQPQQQQNSVQPLSSPQSNAQMAASQGQNGQQQAYQAAGQAMQSRYRGGGPNDGKATLTSMDGGGGEPWKQQAEPQSPQADQGGGGWNDGKSTLTSMNGGGGEPWKQPAPAAPAPQNSITALSGMQGAPGQQPQQQNAAAVKQPQAGTQPAAAPTPTAPTAAAPAQQQAKPAGGGMSSPFGQMNFGGGGEGGTPKMAAGRIVTHPTRAIIGDNGPEAVVPLDNPDANVTPGMFSPHRYRAVTGPKMVHSPMHAMGPASLDHHMKGKSNWKRWDDTH